MRGTKVILIHILCWSVLLGYQYGGYLLKIVSFAGAAFGISISLVQLIAFYICFLWVYPSYLKRKKIPQLTFGLFVAMAAFILFRYLIEEVVYLKLFGINNYPTNTTLIHYVTDNIYYGSSFIVLALAIHSAQQNFRDELMTNSLRAEAVKAELAFLKSQINPHFLYNTLNYIYALAIPVSKQLAEAVLRLSSLMRYTLSESPNGKVRLTKEIEYLESYIALSKMRFAPHFHVNFKAEGWKETDEIAALILIPFVENAFKHGVIDESDHPIIISLAVKSQSLLFQVSNKIGTALKDPSSGIGLANVQRRLDLIYPGQHKLQVTSDGIDHQVELLITLSPNVIHVLEKYSKYISI